MSRLQQLIKNSGLDIINNNLSNESVKTDLYINKLLSSENSHNFYFLKADKLLSEIDNDEFSLESITFNVYEQYELSNTIDELGEQNEESFKIASAISNVLSLEDSVSLGNKIKNIASKVIDAMAEIIRKLGMIISNIVAAFKKFVAKLSAKNYDEYYKQKNKILSAAKMMKDGEKVAVKSSGKQILACKENFFTNGIGELKNNIGKISYNSKGKIKEAESMVGTILKVAVVAGAGGAAAIGNELAYRKNIKKNLDEEKRKKEAAGKKYDKNVKNIDKDIRNNIKGRIKENDSYYKDAVKDRKDRFNLDESRKEAEDRLKENKYGLFGFGKKFKDSYQVKKAQREYQRDLDVLKSDRDKERKKIDEYASKKNIKKEKERMAQQYMDNLVSDVNKASDEREAADKKATSTRNAVRAGIGGVAGSLLTAFLGKYAASGSTESSLANALQSGGSVGKILIYGTPNPQKKDYTPKEVLEQLPFELLSPSFVNNLSSSCDELKKCVDDAQKSNASLNKLKGKTIDVSHPKFKEYMDRMKAVRGNLRSLSTLSRDIFQEGLYLRGVLGSVCKKCLS